MYYGRLGKKVRNCFKQIQFKRLQIVQFEYPTVRNPCVSSNCIILYSSILVIGPPRRCSPFALLLLSRAQSKLLYGWKPFATMRCSYERVPVEYNEMFRCPCHGTPEHPSIRTTGHLNIHIITGHLNIHITTGHLNIHSIQSANHAEEMLERPAVHSRVSVRMSPPKSSKICHLQT